MTRVSDPVILNLWHPISSIEEMVPRTVHQTVLLEEKLSYAIDDNGQAKVWRSPEGEAPGQPYESSEQSDTVFSKLEYDYVWACLGDQPKKLFLFSEYFDKDRRFVPTGMFGVNVAPGRAIENFLDMSHFPFIHTGVLGEEPHTEIVEYDVEVSAADDEVRATRCRFYQPKAALASDSGAEIEYTYRVPHPNCALLYKSSPNDPVRPDVIYMFIQPVGEEQILAHTGMCILDDDNTDKAIRDFQQHIFGQDKPILENQRPKKLPLDPRAETPIRADRSAIAYRRWLSSKNLTYGVIPSTSHTTNTVQA